MASTLGVLLDQDPVSVLSCLKFFLFVFQLFFRFFREA